ncbi:insulinase family protein [Clostridium akagii]|uniref:insulinase family protein n=1 Tax=Clostridium akagii TaxID=91623 RepID=UPI0004796018|nr:insulinase family protein [Clostridium akagii]
MNFFEKDDICHGFKFLQQEEVKEINATAFIFQHVKSGAKLLYLENDDDNKVFSISFRTPPKDSTGVFHILEHSVLCGSEKYPVKEPFVELLKGSLNTFLNAFTFSDKTMYPVASKNNKDFLNLIGVYMDSVFHPNIYKYEDIFKQEGWHYELNKADEDITYKGVVYNEMKGAFSSPDGILMRKIQNSLFPDTTYGFESGGDPENIPDLTYENFIDSHKKYYSPANSYIYLYGAMNLEEKLEFLDKEYLSSYDKIQVDSSIQLQKPIGVNTVIVEEYPILSNESEIDKTYLSLNFATEKSNNAEISLAFDILEYLLLESSAAPLKKALLNAGIGKDVSGVYDNSILQPYFSVILKNSNEEKQDEFKKVVFETLKELVNHGIDKKLIEAAISVKEFQLREADFGSMPKGLIYSIVSMESWLYDENPLVNLKFEDSLSRVKSALTTNYFEKIIDKYMLNSNHQSLVIVKPSKTIGERSSNRLKERLKEFKNSLNSEDLKKILIQTENLKIRQESEDSAEDLRKIPLLSLSDIDREPEKIPLSETEIHGIKTLYHNIFTNKIAYFNLYFDSSKISKEHLPYLALLEEILGMVDTEKYKYDELANEINIKTGEISFTNTIIGSKDTTDDYYPKFTVKVKVLSEKIGESIEILHQIMYKSKFHNKKRIKEIVQQLKSKLEATINQNGHVVALGRLTSYFSNVGKYNESIKGIEFYKFICDIDKNMDNKYEDICKNIEEVCNSLFTKGNLVISLTGEKAIYDLFKDSIHILEIEDKNTNSEFVFVKSLNIAENEGLTTSSKVQYAVKGYNFKKLGYEYSGKLQVLRNVLSLNYLWNNLRVMGGAYGCGVSISQSGNLVFYSYRDPGLKETLKVYDESYKFADSFNADDYEMTKYIIGTISNLDAPLSSRKKGERSDENYFKKITEAFIQNEREEILSTSKEDIKGYSKLLKDVTEKNYLCVMGNDVKIKENSDIFNNVIEVFE